MIRPQSSTTLSRRSRGAAASLTAAITFATAAAITALATPAAMAETIGEVDTNFRWLGKDDRIVVEAFDDPKAIGITCFVSRARTGGVKGTIGVAEDTSDASIACRQVADTVRIEQKLPAQEDVFSQRASLLFKRIHVVRVVDKKRNTLVYLTYSDRIIEGSPKNAITAVPLPASNPIPTDAK